MRNNGDQGAVYVAVSHTDDKSGGTFAAMPGSKSHTSPRLGVIFLSFKFAKELVGSQGCFPIVQRTGIERYRPAQELHCENPLFLFGQSFEGFQQLGSLLAHNSSLPSFL